MLEALVSRQTNSQTLPRTCTCPVHRLAALSKNNLTDGSLPFFFRLTDLSTELRWWCPICLCTFKGARPHTRSVFTQVDTCSRNKLNQMSVLQISFQIPRLRLPPYPDLLFYSSKSFLIQRPQTLFHSSSFSLCTSVNLPIHTAGGHRAVPTQTSAV